MGGGYGVTKNFGHELKLEAWEMFNYSTRIFFNGFLPFVNIKKIKIKIKKMFGWLWTLVLWIFGMIYFFVKLIIFLVVVLLLLLWRYQGLILYQRHAPDKKRQIVYNQLDMLKNPSCYRMQYDDFYILTKDKVEKKKK
ncbi:hypothetical protein RFI_04950 [Reticulomyxa filosa]|uniref:Uncharacterized protein n=1 Tax=Reticulomyxa filosa TaxID=46433 RepID=X6P205_RETFI|nr:hypothetical protein RFI_04950 [Reticulomyxa filosa]|eukprot:ETO32168.1 hypothetical protein RFI_04950 [Reticulomyxa filosa]